MLEEMRIQGLGVIDDAVLALAPGLTVVSGETGAGKTMVVTGLDLLLGGRADSGLVRTGAGRAVVEARLRVDPGGPVAARARDAGAELDDDVLIVSRSVSAEGRSRAHVGGRGVPVSLLSELGEDLVAVHGQSGQRRLLQSARQRAALDRFAGAAVGGPLADYRAAYDDLRAVETEARLLADRGRERAREADLLRFGLAEIAAAAPEPGEDVRLAAEAERLAHADALQAAAALARQALVGDPDAAGSLDASGLVADARRALDGVRRHDVELAALADRTAEAGYLLADVAADLASYAASVDVDPARLAAVEDRRAVLAALARKYGDTVEEVLAWARHAAAQEAEIGGDEERAAELRSRRTALRERLGVLAATVSAARTEAARRFAQEVGAELAVLAMPGATVSVDVRQEAEAAEDGLEVAGRRLAFGPSGVDTVEVLLRPHAGAPIRPLHRGASGGELSRVMLAVEVVFAGADPVPTFVFDEVDAGVGGAAAVEVGRRLARLARGAQVVVVTHLPQVAAFADRHLLVEKSADGRVTHSGASALDGAGRVRELSRMLAGLAESELAHAHAEELLEVAGRAKAGS